MIFKSVHLFLQKKNKIKLTSAKNLIYSKLAPYMAKMILASRNYPFNNPYDFIYLLSFKIYYSQSYLASLCSMPTVLLFIIFHYHIYWITMLSLSLR